MQLNNTALDETLQEIKDLEAEIKSQENKYNSLLKADEPFEILREIRIKIRYLQIELRAKQESLRLYPIIQIYLGFISFGHKAKIATIYPGS